METEKIYKIWDKKYKCYSASYETPNGIKSAITQRTKGWRGPKTDEEVKQMLSEIEIHTFDIVLADKKPAALFHKKYKKFAPPLEKLVDRLKDE